MTQLVPRDDVPLEVIREGALEETAQDLGTGSRDGTGQDRTSPAQPWPGWAPFLGDWDGYGRYMRPGGVAGVAGVQSEILKSTPTAELPSCGRPPWGPWPCSPRGNPSPWGVAHLVVEGRDEPQLHLEVGASFLGSNELQQVLVLHAGRAEDLPLTLPRLLVLRQGRS